MPTVTRCLADSDGVRIVDEDGYYIMIDGDLTELMPPRRPTGLVYDAATGTLSCDSQADASEHRFYSNDYAAGENTRGARVREAGAAAIAAGTPSQISDGAIAAGELRAYDAAAYDALYDVEGPPCRPVYSLHSDRRL